jgi:hypothetical protein
MKYSYISRDEFSDIEKDFQNTKTIRKGQSLDVVRI